MSCDGVNRVVCLVKSVRSSSLLLGSASDDGLTSLWKILPTPSMQKLDFGSWNVQRTLLFLQLLCHQQNVQIHGSTPLLRAGFQLLMKACRLAADWVPKEKQMESTKVAGYPCPPLTWASRSDLLHPPCRAISQCCDRTGTNPTRAHAVQLVFVIVTFVIDGWIDSLGEEGAVLLIDPGWTVGWWSLSCSPDNKFIWLIFLIKRIL